MDNKPRGSYHIEKAMRSEIYEIAAFLDACWQASYRGIITPDFLAAMTVNERHEKLLKRFDDGISEFLVMRDGNRIIGAAVFGKSFTEGYPDHGEISAIYLHQDFIGKGYGHALLTEIERMLSKMGYAHFVLDVLTENKRAVKFYLEHGYEKVSNSYIHLGESDYPLTVFSKANMLIGEGK